MDNDGLKVLELFCGIGGMHWALKGCNLQSEVMCAIDINTVTNAIYKHNFPNAILAQREIQSLTSEEIGAMNVNTVLMSPPCQPFTRVGLKKDADDPRTKAFFALLQNIERMQKPVKYIFVENVKGFEDSHTRDHFIEFLNRNGYIHQEYLLTPLQFGIPNSRLRYYCMARHKDTCGDFIFSTSDQVLTDIPPEVRASLLSPIYIESHRLPTTVESESSSPEEQTQLFDSIEEITPLGQYLENNEHKQFILNDKDMKYYEGLDIREPTSRNSCCFTKRYGHYFIGSGSFLWTGNVLRDGRKELRYFTPTEAARLMHFPSTFSFPESVSRKQRYKAIGNSLNVYVVSNLIRLMTL